MHWAPWTDAGQAGSWPGGQTLPTTSSPVCFCGPHAGSCCRTHIPRPQPSLGPMPCSPVPSVRVVPPQQDRPGVRCLDTPAVGPQGLTCKYTALTPHPTPGTQVHNPFRALRWAGRESGGSRNLAHLEGARLFSSSGSPGPCSLALTSNGGLWVVAALLLVGGTYQVLHSGGTAGQLCEAHAQSAPSRTN